MKRVKLKIFGKVQGVSYRYNAKLEAQKLGLVGCVENQTDGSVYIEAQGSKEKLDEFIAWCRRGPKQARVDKMEIAFSDNLKDYQAFESIHSHKTE